MKIEPWIKPEEQSAKVGRHHWSVPRLIQLASALPVMDVPLDHLYLWYDYGTLSLREMVMHWKAAEAANLAAPIILDEDGVIMDGRHRLMKAMMLGLPTIKAVRFDKNPPPDKEDAA